MGRALAISEKNRQDYNEAVDLLERIATTENRQNAQELWEKALILAGLCRNRDEQNDEFNYLLGYAYYKAPEKTAQIWQEAEHFLHRATALNPNHELARYYLACVLFDRRRYPESLAEFNKVSQDAFVRAGQAWRVVKIQELRLCCSLYIEPAKVALGAAENFRACYWQFEDDPLLAPLPTELADCLESLLTEQHVRSQLRNFTKACVDIFKMLRAGDLIEDRWPLLSAVSKEK